MSYLSNLRITKLALHRIQKSEQRSSEATTTHGDELVEVTEEIEAELVRRLSESLGAGSNSIQMEIDLEETQSAINDLTESIDTDDNDIFLEKSKVLANLLASSSQHRSIQGGPFFVLKGLTTSNDRPFIAVIKAEYSSGFQQDQEAVRLLRNIFLTPNQKLFKIGFITIDNAELDLPERYEQSNLICLVFDVNTSHRNNGNFATYFYKKFLGLKFRETEEVLTRDFFDFTKSFFIQRINDADIRFDHMNRLYAYLTSRHRLQLNINTFIRENIDDEYQESYRAELSHRSLPRTGFVKNNLFIEKTLMKRVLVFEDQKIRIPYGLLNQSQVIIDKESGQTTIVLQGVPTEQ
jgi:hypothetical protein